MRHFPSLMKRLHAIPFEYADGDGIDFYPEADFLSEEETSEWFHPWTGNDQADSSLYLIFGADGTGGMAAFWEVRESEDLLDQPIVFFGSEGEVGVVASNFKGYLRLLANGIGPFEAIAYKGLERPIHPDLERFALEQGVDLEQPAWSVVEAARAEFPSFESDILAICDLNLGNT